MRHATALTRGVIAAAEHHKNSPRHLSHSYDRHTREFGKVGVMWEQLSPTQKFRAVASGVLAPCNFAFGMFMLSSGAGVRGVELIAVGVYCAYLSYKTATSPPAAAPVSGAEFKKCPDCGKFTRKANVCRHCGHDLTHSVSGTPPTKRYENSATVRCKYCQHVQIAPVGQETFLCEHCKAHLRGRSAPAESI
jgi:hypothetical protein